MGKINVDTLRRQYQLEPETCMTQLYENMESKALKPDDFSFRDLFIALHPDGQRLLYECAFTKGRGNQVALREAAQYVSTGDFSNITGQIIYNKVRGGYAEPSLLWNDLVTVVPTEFLNGERIPGVGGISPSLIEKVEEQGAYPTIGLNENWLDTKATVKHGAIIGFSRESIIADRTGLMLKQAGDMGKAASVAVEKEVVDMVVGATNGYNRNGVSTNTYLTSGAYINSTTGNALDGAANEWRALEKADLLFDAMTNPDTGEPIGVPTSPAMLVPSALVRTANRIVGATEVQTVDMRAQATTIRTTGSNPYGGKGVKVLSNQYVKSRSGSTTKWWYGDFKEAFLWMQVWAIETMAAANNDEPMFLQDVWSRHKVSYRGVGQPYEPRKVTQSDT